MKEIEIGYKQYLKSGAKVRFSPTGNIFEITKVTDSQVSWEGNLTNKFNTVSISCQEFSECLKKGIYTIVSS